MALRFLSLLMHEVLARGEVVSGFTDTVEYQFANSQDTFYFLGLTQSFASYVRDNEQEFTYTFRTFLKDDNLSVLILERFVNKTAHDQLHLPSAAHTAFSKEVGDWNATSGAIIGKVRGYWYETEYGTFSADDLVSGFADTVVYRFDSKEDAQTYMGFLQPLAEDVKANEQDITYTFRPFTSDDGLSVLLLERFVDQTAHDGPHSSSAAHKAYKEAVTAWNTSTGAIAGKVHSDWYETNQGVISRADLVLV